MCYGNINILDETTIEITELPIRSWTTHYKESVLDVMLMGTDKIQPCITYVFLLLFIHLVKSLSRFL